MLSVQSLSLLKLDISTTFINSWLSNRFHCPHTEISIFSGCFSHGVTQWVLHSAHSLTVLPFQLCHGNTEPQAPPRSCPHSEGTGTSGWGVGHAPHLLRFGGEVPKEGTPLWRPYGSHLYITASTQQGPFHHSYWLFIETLNGLG